LAVGGVGAKELIVGVGLGRKKSIVLAEKEQRECSFPCLKTRGKDRRGGEGMNKERRGT